MTDSEMIYAIATGLLAVSNLVEIAYNVVGARKVKRLETELEVERSWRKRREEELGRARKELLLHSMTAMGLVPDMVVPLKDGDGYVRNGGNWGCSKHKDMAAKPGSVVVPDREELLRQAFRMAHPASSPAAEDAWVAARREYGQSPSVREIKIPSYGDPAQAEKLAEFEKSAQA